MCTIAILAAEETKFFKAAYQVDQLNIKFEEILCRYNHALKHGMKMSRHHLRIQLHVVQHMRNTYYVYAREKADVVAELRFQLFGQVVGILEEGLLSTEYEDTVMTDESRPWSTKLLDPDMMHI